jgi:hypothetical protein
VRPGGPEPCGGAGRQDVRSKRYLGVFDEHKVETRIPISGAEDIYAHAEYLRRTVARYLTTPIPAEAPVTGEEAQLTS